MIFHSNHWKHLDNIIVQKILLKRVQQCNLRTDVKTKNPIFFKWVQGRIYYIQNTMIREGGGAVEYLPHGNRKLRRGVNNLKKWTVKKKNHNRGKTPLKIICLKQKMQMDTNSTVKKCKPKASHILYKKSLGCLTITKFLRYFRVWNFLVI